MRKFSVIALLVAFVLALSVSAFAAAPTATSGRVSSMDKGIQYVVGLGDLSSGKTVNVTDPGAIAVTNIAREVTAQLGDGQLYTGACYLQGVLVTGVSAVDSAAIYYATSATGTAKFDPKVDTANGSFYFDAKGAYFATGIYVDTTDTEVHVSITYDY